MKALPSIAFSEFRGTAGDVTARRTGGRTVLNGRAQHSHIKSPKQSVRRASFGYITKQFKQLTAQQLLAWQKLAEIHREHALVGAEGVPLTAHNLFVCLNANRSLVGVPLAMDAPEQIHGSDAIAFDDIWITPERILISGLRDADNPNSRLVVKMSPGQGPGISKAWDKTVIVGDFETSDWGDLDLLGVYTKCSELMWYQVRSTSSSSTGLTSFLATSQKRPTFASLQLRASRLMARHSLHVLRLSLTKLPATNILRQYLATMNLPRGLRYQSTRLRQDVLQAIRPAQP